MQTTSTEKVFNPISFYPLSCLMKVVGFSPTFLSAFILYVSPLTTIPYHTSSPPPKYQPKTLFLMTRLELSFWLPQQEIAPNAIFPFSTLIHCLSIKQQDFVQLGIGSFGKIILLHD